MSPSISPVSKKINHICATLIAYWLPVLYFLIATAFYLKTYDSAQIKITLIEIGGVVLLAIWLIKIIESDSFFFKRSLLVIVPLVAYLLSGIFSFTKIKEKMLTKGIFSLIFKENIFYKLVL